MISKRYNAQMGNYLAKLAQEQNNLGTWQESIIKEDKTKQTNADRIRAMTDEELAKWMALNTDCYYCKARKDGRCDNLTATPCGSVWLDWLKQEVSNG